MARGIDPFTVSDTIADSAVSIAALLAQHGPRRPLHLSRDESVQLDQATLRIENGLQTLRGLISGTVAQR